VNECVYVYMHVCMFVCMYVISSTVLISLRTVYTSFYLYALKSKMLCCINIVSSGRITQLHFKGHYITSPYD